MVAELLSFEESPDSTKQRCRVTPGRGDRRKAPQKINRLSNFLGKGEKVG